MNWSNWNSWQSGSMENVYVDENGIKWVAQSTVGSIQHEPIQQPQQNEMTSMRTTSTPTTTSNPQAASSIQRIPPQPVQPALSRGRDPGKPVVLRGSSPVRRVGAIHESDLAKECDGNDQRREFEKKIYQHVEKIKNDIFAVKDEISGFSNAVKNIDEIKQKIFKDHLTTGIQISCLRDEMKDAIKSLREDLWYQCDHMKFVNAIDEKFSIMEKKFEKFLNEPNVINEKENSSENEINEGTEIERSIATDDEDILEKESINEKSSKKMMRRMRSSVFKGIRKFHLRHRKGEVPVPGLHQEEGVCV